MEGDSIAWWLLWPWRSKASSSLPLSRLNPWREPCFCSPSIPALFRCIQTLASQRSAQESAPLAFAPPARGHMLSLLCVGFGVRRTGPRCRHGSHSLTCCPYFRHSWFGRLQGRIAVRKRRTPPAARCQLAALRALLQKGTCWTSSPHSRLRDLCESVARSREELLLADGRAAALPEGLQCVPLLFPSSPSQENTRFGQDLWKGVSGVTSVVANDDVFGLYRLVLFSRFHCSLKQCLITREIDRIESPKYHTLKMRLNAPFLFFPAHIVICGLFYTSEVIVYRLYYAMGFFLTFKKLHF